MSKENRLFRSIQEEFNKSDKHLRHVEFNKRGAHIIMNFEYDETAHEDVHHARHDKDPEFISEEELEALIEKLNKENLPYQLRRDEFM